MARMDLDLILNSADFVELIIGGVRVCDDKNKGAA